MILATKIKLNPTDKQIELFKKSAGVARWSYNFFIRETERHLKEYNDGKQKFKFIKEGEVRKYINNVLKTTEEYKWLKEVGSNVMKQAVKDSDDARTRWINKESGKPNIKTKRKCIPKFYVNYETLKKVNCGFSGEKLGVVKTYSPLPKLKKGEKYSNPRISFDGKYWYLSVGYDQDCEQYQTTGETIGIDVGIKDLAICSNGMTFKNINKTVKVRHMKRRLKREQRKLSRKYESNVKTKSDAGKETSYYKPFYELKNFNKQSSLIKLLHKKLNDIRTNHLHQASSKIVKTKPSCIVMEDLNIRGMMKNRHLSKAISEQKLYEFKRQIKYKCEMHGIVFKEADRWYPSSKTCSNCGQIKSDLKLKDRLYKCDCGLVLDRDLNAAINLANCTKFKESKKQ